MWNTNIEINKNTIFGLLGPNGSGKSTLLNILLGKIKKTGGNIRMEKKSFIQNFKNIVFGPTPFQIKKMGAVFQNDALWPEMKVYHVILFFSQYYNIDQEPLYELMKMFKFEHYLNNRVE